MERRKRWIVAGAGLAAAALLAIQMVPVARANPPGRGTVTAPPEVMEALRSACFDCHSAETRWPWYSRVAPASWLIADHVREGREHLDFSSWTTLPADERAEKAEEIAEELGEGEMPLRSYTLLHPEARLDEARVEAVIRWARGVEEEGSTVERRAGDRHGDGERDEDDGGRGH